MQGTLKTAQYQESSVIVIRGWGGGRAGRAGRGRKGREGEEGQGGREGEEGQRGIARNVGDAGVTAG